MKVSSILLSLSLTLMAGQALAQATPAGLWRTIDDETKTEKSLVRISESGGVFTGKVEKIADASKQDSTCDKCSDSRKDQKVIGMTIVTGVKKAEGAAYFDGGEILDPNNGKVYKVRMTPKDGGKTLEVRGYIGAPLLGRTQVWQRVE
jgi:uncharacterized protein (DUF2147 family)